MTCSELSSPIAARQAAEVLRVQCRLLQKFNSHKTQITLEGHGNSTCELGLLFTDVHFNRSDSPKPIPLWSNITVFWRVGSPIYGRSAFLVRRVQHPSRLLSPHRFIADPVSMQTQPSYTAPPKGLLLEGKYIIRGVYKPPFPWCWSLK